MDPRVKRVVDLLDAFVPSEIETDTTGRLYEIFSGFRELPGREAAMPAIFGVMERHPRAEFGTPGPLVHELEALPRYQHGLLDSLARQPTPLTIWMVNRILNTPMIPASREQWLHALGAVLDHPKADEMIRQEARDFLAFQEQQTDGTA